MRINSVVRVLGLVAALLVASVGTMSAQSPSGELGLSVEMVDGTTTRYRLKLHHPTDLAQVGDGDRAAVRSVIEKIACAPAGEVQLFRQDLERSSDYVGDMAVIRNWVNRSVACEARTSSKVESVEMRMNTDFPSSANLLNWHPRTTAQLEVNVDPVVRGGFRDLAHLQSTLDDRSTSRCLSTLVTQGKLTEAQKIEYLQNIRDGRGEIVTLPKYLVANYGCGKADGRNIIYEPVAGETPMQAYLQQLSSGLMVFTKGSCANLGLPLQHWEAVAVRTVEVAPPPPKPTPIVPGKTFWCVRNPGNFLVCALPVIGGIYLATRKGDNPKDEPVKTAGSPPRRVVDPGFSVSVPFLGGRRP